MKNKKTVKNRRIKNFLPSQLICWHVVVNSYFNINLMGGWFEAVSVFWTVKRGHKYMDLLH